MDAPLTYKQFTLDQFQRDAITAIERNNSVVVSAATGTGKTLIADYVINKAIGEGKHVVYTAPIKALSNQKFREFKAAYGDKIGMLTGDVVINPTGQVLIMTTEIYRNMLLEKSPDIANVSYVIFDEIHYINDIERGTVWEESIIFSPDNVRFLCLSATIPNYDQFAKWISTIKHHDVETVNYMKRAVPLNHLVYDTKLGISTIDDVSKDVTANDYHKHSNRYSKSQRRDKHPTERLPYHIDLVMELEEEDKLPCIFFSFSRSLCETRARELAKKRNFTTPQQKADILNYFNTTITDNIRGMQSTRDLKEVVVRGVGVHHAGLFPKLKEIVEHLFDKGYLKVLYATETFAVGINMPAKTVCFSSLEKYDGISFRLLNSKEYFQLAGRAGRRGIDTVGYSIALLDRNKKDDFFKIKMLTTSDTDPIVSRYDLSYNTVLNLIKNHTQEEIDMILKSNFGYFVKKQSQNQVRIMQSYNNYCKILTKLGFLENGALTWKGDFATRIYTRELEVSELVFDKILEKASISEMNIVLASLIYEARRMDKFDIDQHLANNAFKLISQNELLTKKIKRLAVQRVAKIVHLWTSGATFEQLINVCNLAEGDIIRLFRQLIDILRQIKGSLLATDPNNELIGKINESLAVIDRDIISVEL
ncbi:MAG TPA: DEAD/DEAH box helicase [Acidobacteriota bacterium]|nr:DEAD/DEAH box helicase [Acidobacteriota bacterium]